MKYFSFLTFFSLFCILYALPNSTNESESVSVENETSLILPEEKDKQTDPLNPDPLKPNEGGEIIISKDNVIPILRTIVLAFTHKKDPAYQEVLKAGGKTLFKFAEKKIGKDKYMMGLLNIIKKYVVDLTSEEMTDEEGKMLGELAEQYLKKHQFKFMFPESLLLHQRELEEVVSKKKELGEFESRQLQFDFSPYKTKFSQFTNNMKERLQSMPIFSNLNLDRIGTTFTSLGSTIEDYVPALRTGTGITDFGICKYN